jgi:hypothetical protein
MRDGQRSWRSMRATGLLLSAGLTSRVAVAQRSIELGPYLGVYAPTASFGSAPLPSPIPLPSTSRHTTALLVGAEGIFWLSPRLGMAADWGVTSSRARTESGGIRVTESAKISVGTLRVLVPLNVPSLPNRVHLDAGVGLLRRSGDFYQSYRTSRNVAGVLGIGSELRLARQLHAQLRFSSYLYSMQLREPDDTEYESAFQADVTARAGVAWVLEF